MLRFSLSFAVLLGLTLQADRVFAGAPSPVTAPGTPAAATAAARKDDGRPKKSIKMIFEEKPDEAYEQGDRVDPFTLGRPSSGITGTGPETPSGTDLGPVAGYWGRKLHEIRRTYLITELYLNSDTKDRFAKVVSECEKHIQNLKTDIRDLLKKHEDAAKYLSDFQAVLEKFQRLEQTAKRLQLRQEVEADFASKKIVVEGIVWKSGAPSAVVNGEPVTEGSVLSLGGDKGGKITVYRIRKDSVIFLYRNIQVDAHLQRGSL